MVSLFYQSKINLDKLLLLCTFLIRMHSDGIQLGARVRRRNDIGMDIPGVIVRLNSVEALVFLPSDNFYQIIPIADLEVYDSISDLVAA